MSEVFLPHMTYETYAFISRYSHWLVAPQTCYCSPSASCLSCFCSRISTGRCASVFEVSLRL